MIRSDRLSLLILGMLLTFIPAIFYGCQKSVLPIVPPSPTETCTSVRLKGAGPLDGSTFDILTFEDDRLRRLDSYQRVEDIMDNRAYISSTGGKKIFFFCSDSQRNRYSWTGIASYSSLGKLFCDIENENPHSPVITGECRAYAGESCNITLHPLLSSITLKAICCDFSGTPYAQSTIRDVKVYLTNVSATCPIIQPEALSPSRIINTGMLNRYDMARFKHPEIISRHVTKELGRETIWPEIQLMCYPNPKTDNPADLPTRLVVEGKINSETYYWPIEIGEKGKGVSWNSHYIYDIFIRRKGVSDPDISVTPQQMEINMNVKPWKEIEEYIVPF